MRAFSLLFRDSAAARMMDALLDLGGGEISKSDLAKAAGISRDSVYRILPEWEGLGLVRLSRRVGVTKLYGLNQDHPSVAAMRTIDGLFNGPQEFVRRTKPRKRPGPVSTKPVAPPIAAETVRPAQAAPGSAGAAPPRLPMDARAANPERAPEPSPLGRLQEMLKRGVISERTYRELTKKLK